MFDVSVWGATSRVGEPANEIPPTGTSSFRVGSAAEGFRYIGKCRGEGSTGVSGEVFVLANAVAKAPRVVISHRL